ncbi:MAG: HTTM domain-containing protein [Acidimicrobiales bacterium]|nr:HTTM domain-containing protein [Acidimicrobiales bacterium]
MTAVERRPGGVGRLRRLDAHVDDVGSIRAVALLRIALGPVVLVHLDPFLRLVAGGRSYDTQFWSPYWAWYPAPPRWLYAALLWAAAAAAVALTVGLLTRLAAVVTTGVVAYNLFLSTTHFHHNRAFLLVLLLGVTIAPSGRALSIDAWRAGRAGRPPTDLAPLWPLYLLRAEVSLVYLASGGSKLLDPDWWGGRVTWLRVVRVQDQVAASPVGWATDLLADRSFHTGAAKVIVLTELFIGLGLWGRRTRLAAVWVAVAFHLSIEISAHVQVFSMAALAALVIWAVPRTRDRTLLLAQGPSAPRAAHVLGQTVRALDWLARFDLRPAAPGDPPVTLVDRDGTVLEGRAAALLALSRLPVTFWLVAPLIALGRLRSAGRAARR